MFSILGYVPFCNVADMCLRASEEAPTHPLGRHLPLFRDWPKVDEPQRRKARQALGYLMADLAIQSDPDLVMCSPAGLTLTPSQRLVSLGWKTLSLSLDDPLQAFLKYAEGAYWRYEYVHTETWCIRHKPIDPREVDVDEETGTVWIDPMDVVADKFDGWALAVPVDRTNVTLSALLDARLAEKAARATVLPVEPQIGRPNKIDEALVVYDRLYPNGHAHAKASVKSVLRALENAGHPVAEPTLYRGLRDREGNP
jgi:hypothetical protein